MTVSGPPAASEITFPAFEHILSIYQSTLEAVYETKIKDSTKQREAFELDEWRYNELPKQVAEWKGKDGMTKSQLERLVQWKITHGTFRPFLLPQIRKNDAQTVKSITSEAYHMSCNPRYCHTSSPKNLRFEPIRELLDKVCSLTGVGPATGTLLLSILAPDWLVFFEDELYHWLIPDIGGKLKYTTKEYFEILNGMNSLWARFGCLEDEGRPEAWEVEKVGYVIGHWDVVKEKDKQKIDELTKLKEVHAVDRGVGTAESSNVLKRKPDENGSETSSKKRRDPYTDAPKTEETPAKKTSETLKPQTKSSKLQEEAPRRSTRNKK